MHVFHLSEAGDHGEHDAHLAMRRSTQNGPQLLLEHSRAAQGNADAAPAQEGVFLFLLLHLEGQLVATGIQRAENHLLRGAFLHQAAVVLVLGFLIGEAIAPQQEELGTVQAHALCPVALDGAVLMHKLQVAGHADVAAIPRFGRQVAHVQEGLIGFLLLGPHLLVVCASLSRGIENQGAMVAIQDGGSAHAGLSHQIRHRHHRRQPQ